MLNFAVIGGLVVGTIGLIVAHQEVLELFTKPRENMWAWIDLAVVGVCSFFTQFFVTTSYKFQSAAVGALNNSAFGIVIGFALEILYFKVKGDRAFRHV